MEINFKSKADDSNHWRKEIIVDLDEKIHNKKYRLLKIELSTIFSRFLPLNNRKIENINSIIFPHLQMP